jgi:hypothetical protein
LRFSVMSLFPHLLVRIRQSTGASDRCIPHRIDQVQGARGSGGVRGLVAGRRGLSICLERLLQFSHAATEQFILPFDGFELRPMIGRLLVSSRARGGVRGIARERKGRPRWRCRAGLSSRCDRRIPAPADARVICRGPGRGQAALSRGRDTRYTAGPWP